MQIVDLGATILELAGTGATTLGDGVSFADSLEEPATWERDGLIYVENEFGENDHDIRSYVLSAVREDNWKLVLTTKNIKRPPGDKYPPLELYDLDADPEEQNNLIEDERYRDVVERLRQKLTAHSEFLNETGFRHIKPPAMSPEAEAQLRALGYL